MILSKNILPVTTVKKNLMKLLKKVQNERDPLIITKDGLAAGVLMSTEEYEGLIETLEILSDQNLLKSLKKSAEDFKTGRSFTHKEVFGE